MGDSETISSQLPEESDVSLVCDDDNSEKQLRTKSKDAFDVLMKSQKKIIGSNSPGKELQITSDDPDKSSAKESKIKQKLFLEEWAMRKGGDAKKQKEMQREEIVKTALKRRKNKFTSMLLQSDEINRDVKKKQSPNGSVNILRKSKSDLDYKKTTKKAKLDKIDMLSEVEDFLGKLSPSLKKKENMLCYLKKDDSDKKKSNETQLSSDSSDLEPVNQIKIKITSKRLINSVNKRKEKSLPDSVNHLPSKSTNIDDDDSLVENKKETLENLKVNDNNVVENQEALNIFNKDASYPVRRSLRLVTKDNFKNKIKGNSDYLSSDTSDDECILNKKKKRDKENFIVSSDSESSKPKRKQDKKQKSNNPPSKNIKLAPLFTKGVVKPLIDPEVLKARQNFLYSTLEKPEKPSQALISEENLNIFHTVVHIQQIPVENDSESYIWDLQLLDKFTDDSDLSMPLKPNSDSKIILSYIQKEDIRATNNSLNKIEVYDCKDSLLALKKIYPKYPIFKFFKQIRQKSIKLKNDESNNLLQKNNDDCIERVVDDSIIENKSIVENCNVKNILWTEKYKPSTSEELIGNFKNVELLKKWLTSWKEYSQELLSNRPMKKKIDSDSSSEFWSSDSESRGSSGFIDNTYVLTGPVGSGKTSSVYAIANELNMNVIEVNASSKRTGKKILLKLQEATQSHKVKIGKETINNASVFAKKSNSINKKKKKDRLVCKLKDTLSIPTKDKMSIILIEDADIVFDEDDGFVSALIQIVRISKRPVIIVSSDMECPHLEKFMHEHNTLKFHPLSAKIVAPWLNLLMLIECGKICLSMCNFLIRFHKGDIRKTIMQLQCWVLGSMINNSNYDFIECDKKELSEYNGSLSKDHDSLFFEDINNEDCIDNNIHLKFDKSITNSKSKYEVLFDILYFSPREEISWTIKKFHYNMSNDIKSNKTYNGKDPSLIKTLDTISSIDYMQSYSKNISNSYEEISRWCRISDSLLELQNEEEYVYDFASDYCQSMIDCKSNLRNMDVTLEEVFLQDTDRMRWIGKQNSIYTKLCEYVPVSSQLDRRSLSIDYMAYLRNICCSEKSRCDTNGKRNNRFSHYLSTSNVNVNDLIGESCKLFKINAI